MPAAGAIVATAIGSASVVVPTVPVSANAKVLDKAGDFAPLGHAARRQRVRSRSGAARSDP